MASSHPGQRLRDLQRRIGVLAKQRATTAARLQRLVGFAVLCETLVEAVAQGLIPFFFVKGGVALELRLGLAARATKDLDIGLCASPQELLADFDEALTVGYGDFTLRRKGPATVLDNGTRRLVVAVEYHARPFALVDVDLASATPQPSIDAVSPIALADLGLTTLRPVPCLDLTEQVAQKIHALTEPTPQGRPNPRERDVIDILLLDGRLSLDYGAIAEACSRIFALRATHVWPSGHFSFPPQWNNRLPALAREAGYDTEDAAELESRLNTFFARLHGAPNMPGYEYQFVSLQVNPSPSPTDGPFQIPIDTRSIHYLHFTALAEKGWRVRFMQPRPGDVNQVLVLMERQKEAAATPTTRDSAG